MATGGDILGSMLALVAFAMAVTSCIWAVKSRFRSWGEIVLCMAEAVISHVS